MVEIEADVVELDVGGVENLCGYCTHLCTDGDPCLIEGGAG